MNKIIRTAFIAASLFSLVISVNAQDMLSGLDSSSTEKDFTIATFKSTRLIDQQTIETVGPHTLDFRISHRFGPLNSGAYNAWGLDGPASIRLGLEYSPNGRWMFGIGRTSYDRMVDGFLKYKLIRQTTDDGTPLSLTLFAGAYYTAQKDGDKTANGYDKYEYTSSRMSYAFEAMLARKFSKRFSLQVAPWFVHYNLAIHITDQNDAYGVAGLFRFKFTNRAAIVFEYGWRANTYTLTDKYFDSMGIGYELETGGHVFQIHLTNSMGIVESQFFPHTDSKWNNMGIRIGFNISRVFTIGK